MGEQGSGAWGGGRPEWGLLAGAGVTGRKETYSGGGGGFLWAQDSGLPGIFVGAGRGEGETGWDGVLVGPVRRFPVCGSQGANRPAQFGGAGGQGRG